MKRILKAEKYRGSDNVTLKVANTLASTKCAYLKVGCFWRLNFMMDIISSLWLI